VKIWYRFVHHKDAVKTCYALLLLTKLKHKDEYTAEHSLNVSILSAAFGKRLGLLEAEIRRWVCAVCCATLVKQEYPWKFCRSRAG